MQHLIILLPIIGIIVFWLLPLGQAIPVYLVILVMSGLMYWAIIRAMRKRHENGAESLVGNKASVVSRLSPQEEAQYIVRVRGELWSANSDDDLKPGETVKILSVDGLTLQVSRQAVGPPTSPAKKP
jgi:membrane protein implicated in regulation of membrane protease activity